MDGLLFGMISLYTIVIYAFIFAMGYVAGNFWKRNKIISIFAGIFAVLLMFNWYRSPVLLLISLIIVAIGLYLGYIKTPIKKSEK